MLYRQGFHRSYERLRVVGSRAPSIQIASRREAAARFNSSSTYSYERFVFGRDEFWFCVRVSRDVCRGVCVFYLGLACVGEEQDGSA